MKNKKIKISLKYENTIISQKIPKKSGIYSIKNEINGKIYIGSAVNIRERIVYEHIVSLMKGRHINKHLQFAWEKYGRENFSIEILEYVDDPLKLRIIEQQYLDKILYADKFLNKKDKRFKKLGYNISPKTFGWNKPIGEKQKKTILQYDLSGNFIKEWVGIQEAQRKLNIGGIWYVCQNKYNKTVGGFIWRYKETDKIPLKINIDFLGEGIGRSVLKYSKEGTFIKEYFRIGIAAKEHNVNSKSIWRAINGKRKTCAGFIWVYTDNEIIEKINVDKNKIKNINRSILQYTIDGVFIREWTNISIAEKETNNKGIRHHLLDSKRKQSGGYVWKYKD